MSEVIRTIEDFEKAAKGSNIKFKASEDTYDFEFINKPKISADGYLSKVKKISENWSYKSVLGNPTIFTLNGENVLSINLPNLEELVRDKMETISGFSISRNYEESKKLADYMLEVFRPEK
jgi:hypothetical protein